MRTATTITVNEKAYRLLKALKRPGDNFSDVILEHIRPPARTAGELLEQTKPFRGKQLIDHDLMAQVAKGPGRRSNRPKFHAA